jgi:pyruvate dehydrogenase E1 component beta subunit
MTVRDKPGARAPVRTLDYGAALNEAFVQLMHADPRMILIGQGLYNPWYVGSSMVELERIFGTERVIDCPVSENGTTGIAIGTALAGHPTVMVHPRMDFMLLATDQILNQAAKWHYMFGGRTHVPLVIRGIVNRGGEQAAQHSQALQSVFMHIPGLRVVMPSTPYDAKGLLVASVRDGNPVVFIDDRWLYQQTGPVPEDLYEVPLGVGAIRRAGTDVTIVATSYMGLVAMDAAGTLAGQGISAEVIDPRSLSPLDEDLICGSVARTGRLVVVDAAWRPAGAAAEIAAVVAERVRLRGPVRRVTLPYTPAPMSRALEAAYYPTAAEIVAAVRSALDA